MAEVTAAGIMAVTTEDIINQLKAHNNINGQHYGIPYCCPFCASLLMRASSQNAE